MSSAFPTQAAPQFVAGAQPVMTPRRRHIPAWYVSNPHPDLSVTVKWRVQGETVPVLPGFTVGEVAPERRWPIGHDGVLMDQVQFGEKYAKWELEFYEWQRSLGKDAKFAGKPGMNVPAVEQFVAWKIDPEDETKVLQIGYDPHRPASAVPEEFYTSSGEPAGNRLEKLVEAYHDLRLRRTLTQKEVAEVEEHLGGSFEPGGGGVLAAKLEALNDLLRDGLLTPEQHSQKVAMLTGASLAPAPAQAPIESEEKPYRAACGRCFKMAAHLAMHMKHCKGECKDAEELSGDAA